MTRPLRIGVDARSLLCREPRGEGKTLLRLIRGMVAQAPHVQLLLFGDGRAAHFGGTLPDRVRVVSGSVRGDRFNTWEQLLLPLWLWRHRCDVLHAASSSAPGWCPVPVVMTVHDLIPLVFDDGQDAGFRRRFAQRLDRGVRRADRVIAVSAHTRRDLLARHPGLRALIEVIHWGAEPVSPAGPDAPATTALRRDAPFVLAFGGEARRKNTDAVLDRWSAVARRVPALRLVLTGISANWQRRAVQERLARDGLSDRVDLPGFVGEGELARLLSSARLVFYPSLYEGFGLPVTEAIAQGTPVLCSDRSSLPEVLGDAPGCVDIDRHEDVEALLQALVENDALRRDWIDRQKGVLARLRWDDVAARTLTVLEQAARAGRPARLAAADRVAS